MLNVAGPRNIVEDGELCKLKCLHVSIDLLCESESGEDPVGISVLAHSEVGFQVKFVASIMYHDNNLQSNLTLCDCWKVESAESPNDIRF